MRKIIALAALSIALSTGAAAAATAPLPDWPANAACSPGDDACPAFESEYKGRVSGIWRTLPPKVRGECVSSTETFMKSYRLLYDCLASEMHTLLKNQQLNPDHGEVVNLTPPARTQEPPAQSTGSEQPGQAQATTPPRTSQPSPPLATEPAQPATPGSAAPAAGPAPTPSPETKQPLRSDVTPPAASGDSPPAAADPPPPSAAQPAPPTATEPTPTPQQ